MSSRTKKNRQRKRKTCVSIEFSSQSDGKLFRYYQLYCRIFVATATKPTIVHASTAYVYTNRTEFDWLSGMCRWRKTDRLKNIHDCMYVDETTAPFTFFQTDRMSTCGRAFLCTCMCMCICICVCMRPCVCVREYKDEKWAWTQSNSNCCT